LTDAPVLQKGLVIAGHGRHVWVEAPDGRRLICHPRGKKSQCVVGDHVLWLASQDEGTIEKIEPRRNLFYRQDDIRTKSFAANLDQIMVVIAAEPEFSEHQLSRALIAAEAQNIHAIIAVNKRDIQPAFERTWRRMQAYQSMGYRRIDLALNPSDGSQQSLGSLESLLHGKRTLVLGASGVGKSTLINRLVPDAQVITNSLSTALQAGKHTTTSTTLYWVDPARSTAVIDSPGFQEFGLQHLKPVDLPQLMPDLRAQLGQCKFYNCTHLHEPGCGVIASLNSPSDEVHITTQRYKIYTELFAELSQQARY
jgi:ribosome biogenesis GTPase / thiamine phosphate phosphatase